MATPGNAPIDGEVAGAIAAFFHGGAGPAHSAISRVLVESGYDDDYEYKPSIQGPNKQSRVLAAFGAARRRPRNARQLVDGLLTELRLAQLLGTGASSENVDRLKRALGRSGWYLTNEGMLRAFAGVEVNTGGREALEEQLNRLRVSTQDPALQLGTAKELLESVAKFVLEEHGFPDVGKKDFNELWHLARERLGVLPQQVDPDLPGAPALRKIYTSIWHIAEQTNYLRNLQGTGHGRTLPSGVSEPLAFLVVREACTVAEYMLALLERSHGR
ncbi:MAG: abortive infection family protein [Sphingomonadales bacterium]|nr:abortive infection family protein [Sphingomonadales bacterium]